MADGPVCSLPFDGHWGKWCAMGLPTEPVTLEARQIQELNQKLSTMRHDINNYLSLILAGAELAKYKPELVKRMVESVSQQPAKITEAMRKFSEEFDKAFGITRP
jgi:hypothetical protein